MCVRLCRQRKKYQNKAHTPEQTNKLEEIGFVFDPYSFKWNAMYEKIQEYKVKVGDINVWILGGGVFVLCL